MTCSPLNILSCGTTYRETLLKDSVSRLSCGTDSKELDGLMSDWISLVQHEPRPRFQGIVSGRDRAGSV